MTDLNHRRSNRAPVSRRHRVYEYHNGNPRGISGYLDKSMHSWGAKAPLSGKRFNASIGNDFCNGHRGMARDVAGAKKFVRTRTRFHENAETRRLAAQVEADLG